LGELARALERADVSPAAASRLLEAASIATVHAVTLDLLTSQRARQLWREAAEQHPNVVQLKRFARSRAATRGCQTRLRECDVLPTKHARPA
jgi:hypothetical protein